MTVRCLWFLFPPLLDWLLSDQWGVVRCWVTWEFLKRFFLYFVRGSFCLCWDSSTSISLGLSGGRHDGRLRALVPLFLRRLACLQGLSGIFIAWSHLCCSCWLSRLIKRQIFTRSSCCRRLSGWCGSLDTLDLALLSRDWFGLTCGFGCWYLRCVIDLTGSICGGSSWRHSSHLRLLLLSCRLTRWWTRFGGLSRRRVVLVRGVRVLVRTTRFLLVTRVQCEGEALSTLLIRRWLWHLLLGFQVWVIVLLDPSWGRGTWLYNDRVDVLNLWYFYLLFTILAWGASPSHGLGRVRAVATTAAAHQSRIMSELEALICFSWANTSFMVRSNFTSCKSLLKLRTAVQCGAATLDLLLGLRTNVCDTIVTLWIRGDWIAHLRSCGLLGWTSSTLLLHSEMVATFVVGGQGLNSFGNCRSQILTLLCLLLGTILLTRVVAQTLRLVLLLSTLAFWRRTCCSINLLIPRFICDLVGGDLGLALNFRVSHFIWIVSHDQIIFTIQRLFIVSEFAFQIFWRDNIATYLFRWHKVFKSQQLGLLRALPVSSRVRWDKFDWVIWIVMLSHENHLMGIYDELRLWLIATLFSDTHEHCKLWLKVHVV